MKNNNDELFFEIINSGFNNKELSFFFEYFLRNIQWEQDVYFFNGNKVIPKRKTFMYGFDYSYSNQTKKAAPFDDFILDIKSKIEKKLSLENGYFNGCLLNLYEDGEASISYHVDDESDMEENAIIISFSLGATRKFFFQPIKKEERKEDTHKLTILNGEILIMYPKCQQKYRHSIPKEKDIKEPRISLTFRKFVENKQGKELIF